MQAYPVALDAETTETFSMFGPRGPRHLPPTSPTHMEHVRRYPRDRFSRSLRALCSRLEQRSQVEFEYAAPRGALVQVHGRLRVSAQALWAFGSWAHGAAECRDLDLALALKVDWVDGYGWMNGGLKTSALPGFEAARRALLTAPPLVHIQDAHRILEDGPTGEFAVHPATMKLIWLAPNISAQEKETLGIAGHPAATFDERIAAIKVDPNFKRAARLSDAFPLRTEQTGMDLRQVERAVRAQAQGLISWEFLPHGESRGDSAELTRAEWKVLSRHDTKDQALISRVLAATREVRLRHRKVRFWYGNNCGVWATMLEDRAASCIVITPKWCAQGPNGSLVITKGANHSAAAVKAFETAERSL